MALNGAVAVLMLAVLLGEDAINAFFARRNALPGMEGVHGALFGGTL